MKKLGLIYKWLAMCIVVGFMLISCGSSEPPDISDLWKNDSGNLAVSIKFNDEPKTIQVNGKILPVTIDETSTERIVKINVTDENGDVASWSLQRLWNDNGTDFKIIFSTPDGIRETLSRAKS